MSLKSKICAFTGHRELQLVQTFKRTIFVRFYSENNKNIYYNPHQLEVVDGKFKCLHCNNVFLTTKKYKKPITKNYENNSN